MVCPNNQDCKSFCNGTVSQQVQNTINDQCRGNSVATDGQAYQDCWDNVQNALRQQLPSNVSELANKDFRWEACDLDQACDRSLEYAFNSVNQDCEHLKAQANVCCDNPLCCENPTECQQQQGAGLLPSAGQDMFKGLSSTSVCKKGEQWMQDQTGAVQKMANLCENKAHRCISACGQKISEIQSQFYETCTFDLLAEQHYDPARHTCSEGLIAKYLSFFREGPASTLSHCKTTRNTKPHQMRQVMEVLIATASQLKDCVQAVSAGTGTDSPTADQAGHTTTSANEGIVIGEEHLYTGQIESDPYLNDNSAGREDTGTASPGGGMGPGGGGAPSPGSASTRATASSAGLEATTGFTTKKPNKIKQMPPPPHGVSQLLGANSPAYQGASPTALSNKQARPGEAGAGQKAQARNKASARGHATPSTPGAQAQASGVKVEDSSKRLSIYDIKPRDINPIMNEFGSPHDNIFQRISIRFQYLCKTKRLVGCE